MTDKQSQAAERFLNSILQTSLDMSSTAAVGMYDALRQQLQSTPTAAPTSAPTLSRGSKPFNTTPFGTTPQE